MIATAISASPSDPNPLDSLLEAALGETFGYSWRHRDGCDNIPMELRECCRYMRKFYSDRKVPDYGDHGMSASAAYALGYFPQIYLKARDILLSSVPHIAQLPASIRILDLGAGPGTMTLAVLGALACQSTDATRVCSTTFVDRFSAMAELADRMLACYASGPVLMPTNLRCAPPREVAKLDFRRPESVRQLAANGPYDFVAFGNCLCEDVGLEAPPTTWAEKNAHVVRQYAALLADGGYLLVMEPKLKALVAGVATLHDIFRREPGLTVVAWSSDERLPGKLRDEIPEISREILGKEKLIAWKNGSPSTFLLLRKEPAA